MKTYTVFAVYKDEPDDLACRAGYRQRYGTGVEAENPWAAERAAQAACYRTNRGEEWDGRDETAMLYVAAVLEGAVIPADDYDPAIGDWPQEVCP